VPIEHEIKGFPFCVTLAEQKTLLKLFLRISSILNYFINHKVVKWTWDENSRTPRIEHSVKRSLGKFESFCRIVDVWEANSLTIHRPEEIFVNRQPYHSFRGVTFHRGKLRGSKVNLRNTGEVGDEKREFRCVNFALIEHSLNEQWSNLLLRCAKDEILVLWHTQDALYGRIQPSLVLDNEKVKFRNTNARG